MTWGDLRRRMGGELPRLHPDDQGEVLVLVDLETPADEPLLTALGRSQPVAAFPLRTCPVQPWPEACGGGVPGVGLAYRGPPASSAPEVPLIVSAYRLGILAAEPTAPARIKVRGMRRATRQGVNSALPLLHMMCKCAPPTTPSGPPPPPTCLPPEPSCSTPSTGISAPATSPLARRRHRPGRGVPDPRPAHPPRRCRRRRRGRGHRGPRLPGARAPPEPPHVAERFPSGVTAQLRRIYVRPEHRRRGLARRLVDELLAFAVADGGTGPSICTPTPPSPGPSPSGGRWPRWCTTSGRMPGAGRGSCTSRCPWRDGAGPGRRENRFHVGSPCAAAHPPDTRRPKSRCPHLT